MTLSLQNMRDAILTATGTDLSDWTNGNTDLDLFLNKSWWDIMDQFDFREREGVPVNFTTVEGTNRYDMTAIVSSFDSIQRFGIEDLNDQSHTDLDLITDFTFEDEFVNNSDNYDTPTSYFRRNKYLYLYPTPDDAYTITCYSLITLADLSSGSPPIPQSWHEIIEMGGIWRSMIALRDFQNSRFVKENQAELISNRTPVKVKELSDTKLAAVSVMGRDY